MSRILDKIDTVYSVSAEASSIERRSETGPHREHQKLLQEKDAVLIAHYYTDPEIQALAEETGGFVGDS